MSTSVDDQSGLCVTISCNVTRPFFFFSLWQDLGSNDPYFTMLINMLAWVFYTALFGLVSIAYSNFNIGWKMLTFQQLDVCLLVSNQGCIVQQLNCCLTNHLLKTTSIMQRKGYFSLLVIFCRIYWVHAAFHNTFLNWSLHANFFFFLYTLDAVKQHTGIKHIWMGLHRLSTFINSCIYVCTYKEINMCAPPQSNFILTFLLRMDMVMSWKFWFLTFSLCFYFV